jgi:phosphatidylserine/phosphatidylglycerophosphate/cardiolipin synthase-like enzyme
MLPIFQRAILVAALIALGMTPAAARQPVDLPAHADAPASGMDVGFSNGHNDHAESVVLKVINSSRSTLLVAAYSFTSPVIAEALVAAKRRGVDVRVVMDKSQRTERYTSATFLAHMGIPVRIDAQHKIQHNKYIISDGAHVQTGSFNYTRAAASAGGNAENVVVVWGSPALANAYTQDWVKHWEHATAY